MSVVHVHPCDDLREHVTGGWPQLRCWCRPEVEECENGSIIVHNSMDRREEYEHGRNLS